MSKRINILRSIKASQDTEYLVLLSRNTFDKKSECYLIENESYTFIRLINELP